MQFFKIVLFICFFSAPMTKAQNVLFEFGQTSSAFSYSPNNPERNFYSSKGQLLKLSILQDFLKAHEVSYGVSLFEANSFGQVITTELDYETQFLGVFSMADFNVLSLANRKHCASCTDFNFYVHTGLQLSTLLSGSQKIDNIIYDLKGVEDFKGLWVSPILGTKIRFDASDIISLILTYNYMPMINITDSEEDFKITSSQLSFGIQLWL